MTLSTFETKIAAINQRLIVHLPEAISRTLPSRGMCMAEGTLNDQSLIMPLEPDGKGSHWFEVNPELFSLQAGDQVTVSLQPIDTWIEPEVPEDLMAALTAHHLEAEWASVTTKARWEWIRWIRSTANPKTRQKRLDVMSSKLEDGKKRPCCFDQSRCTEIDVSKSGVLLDLSYKI